MIVAPTPPATVLAQPLAPLVVDALARANRYGDALTAAGLPLRVVHEETGLFMTSGRALRAGARARRERFVVVTSAPMTLVENTTP